MFINPFDQIINKDTYLATSKLYFKYLSIIIFVDKSKSINISIIITNIVYAIVSNTVSNIQ